MGRAGKSETWRHFQVVEKGKKKEATCKYCSHFWANAIVTRLAEHLNVCERYLEFCQQTANEEEDDVEIIQQNNESQAESLQVPRSTSSSSNSKDQQKIKPYLDTMSKGLYLKSCHSLGYIFVEIFV